MDKPQTIFGKPIVYRQFVEVMPKEMSPTAKLFHDWFHPPDAPIKYPQETSSRRCPCCGKRTRKYRTLTCSIWRDTCKHCGWRN